MNIFEQASRKALRFFSARGLIATEDLWQMPLTSKSGFDLDTVAKTVNNELKAQAEESFVQTSSNPRKTELELQLEIVKHVIAAKQAENEARATAAANKEKREKLIAALAKKQDAAIDNLTAEELQAQIAALS
jgi:hypothetical protein